ncbi:helix-turn-helix transcriptional regulator [Mangrovactinospora gilvigrisea]|uniref:Helix-turn-helix transcriptional regulator n=1 Tax=Mangrovactinospora gilvigrisea TaxID=1428644 RepID=A0A1J7C8L0_9ACTN|nr:response regulator transcription factor [Mangrovactinospora gilvigrisea]OIV37868.1 helix-turn-helix transcriptional regulator [Mangrovactinospora gilvigrisea]
MVDADDPLAAAGAVAQLREQPDLEIVHAGDGRDTGPLVAVVVGEQADETVVGRCRKLLRGSGCRVVLLVSRMREADLLRVIECGVSTVLWRRDVTASQLHAAVLGAHRGDGSIPPDLLGRLLTQVGRMQRTVPDNQGPIGYGGLAGREVEVLRLVAEGLDTGEIAGKLAYSERTIKNILQGLMTRMQLRNRAHAVAYALREGFI